MGEKIYRQDTPAQRIGLCQQVVDSWQYARFRSASGRGSIILDGTSAKAIMVLYNALSPYNQGRFASCYLETMAHIAFEVLRRARTREEAQ